MQLIAVDIFIGILALRTDPRLAPTALAALRGTFAKHYPDHADGIRIPYAKFGPGSAENCGCA